MDIDVNAAAGVVQIRAGALLVEDGAALLAGDASVPYLWTVGGRVQLGEDTRAAVLRECREETGQDWLVDRLAVVDERFFWSTERSVNGRPPPIHQFGLYYWMRRREPGTSLDAAAGDGH